MEPSILNYEFCLCLFLEGYAVGGETKVLEVTPVWKPVVKCVCVYAPLDNGVFLVILEFPHCVVDTA